MFFLPFFLVYFYWLFYIDFSGCRSKVYFRTGKEQLYRGGEWKWLPKRRRPGHNSFFEITRVHFVLLIKKSYQIVFLRFSFRPVSLHDPSVRRKWIYKPSLSACPSMAVITAVSVWWEEFWRGGRILPAAFFPSFPGWSHDLEKYCEMLETVRILSGARGFLTATAHGGNTG